jgi:hypothetical protein
VLRIGQTDGADDSENQMAEKLAALEREKARLVRRRDELEDEYYKTRNGFGFIGFGIFSIIFSIFPSFFGEYMSYGVSGLFLFLGGGLLLHGLDQVNKRRKILNELVEYDMDIVRTEHVLSSKNGRPKK